MAVARWRRRPTRHQIESVQRYKKYDAFGNRIETVVDPDGTGGQPATTSRFGYDGMEVWTGPSDAR
jgi:hypothetical protein